jgi:hypothetical protein
MPACLSLALVLVPVISSAVEAPSHLLFINSSHSISDMDDRLELVMQPAEKHGLVIYPTEPWESECVSAYHSVVQGDKATGRPHRIYYDCIEGYGNPPGDDVRHNNARLTAHRRICLATSHDGIRWEKPELGLFNRSGSTANNILVEDSGVSVFFDPREHEPPLAQWKMITSNGAYSSADGLRWRKLPFAPIAQDDTKPTGQYDPRLGKYVIYVRRDIPPANQTAPYVGMRQIGRCVTPNISDWQAEVPAGAPGCEVVFGADALDPQPMDVYTNAWTPYPSIASPLVHLFFPSFYHHFAYPAPLNTTNDGLLDIRLLFSDDGTNLSYVDGARNARSPFVRLGDNTCGAHRHAPSVMGGWCDVIKNARLDVSAPDTSAMYMASGFVDSATLDSGEGGGFGGGELFFYASAQPFTHGGMKHNKTWGNNTGVQLLSVRRDGFAAVEAGYGAWGVGASWERSERLAPTLTTVAMQVPSECSGGGGGGVHLYVNLQTSVAGFVAIELQDDSGDGSGGGQPLEGYGMSDSDKLKGGATSAAASWGGGNRSSLASLAGRRVALRIALADAKLFSVRFGCAQP